MIRVMRMRCDATMIGIALMLVGLASGCNRFSTDYGYSSSQRGTQSLNGFSALRRTFENAGFESRDIRRLGNRQYTLDTLVWTPQVLSPIEDETTVWLDQWLARGGHTLVYIVPDSGSEADYWRDEIEDALPSQQLEYRRRAGQAINDRFQWRLNRDDVPSNGWFQIKPLDSAQPLGRLDGPWSRETAQSLEPSVATGNGSTPQRTRYLELALKAFQPPPANAATTPAASGANTIPQQPVAYRGPTGPSSLHEYYFSSPSLTVTTTKTKFEPLLWNESSVGQSSVGQTTAVASTCFVGKVTSRRWRNSRVLVVAGGSLLTNYAFTQPFARSLADEIVDASSDPQDNKMEVGFITSYGGSLPISELKPGQTRVSGMEILTQWPLSLVTIHAVFLGIVALLIMLPIFGRPRQVIRSSLSRFGDHLDAIAALMYRAGGEEYARRRISEYHRRVRGETSGPWVIAEKDADDPATSTTTSHVQQAHPNHN